MSQSVRYLRYCLTLKAPAVVTTLSGDPNSAATQPFIPGNALRGALAARLLENGMAAESEDFRALILGSGVRYLHAYPANDSTRSLPTPVGWRRRKGHPDASALDLAWYTGDVNEQTTWLVEDGELTIEPEKVWPAAPLDRKGIRPFVAFVGSSTISPRSHTDARMHQQRDREVGRSWRKRENGTETAQGTPFVYEYLEPGQDFHGIVQVTAPTDADADALIEKIKGFLEGQTVLVGRSRRAGYGGAACITFNDQQPHEAKHEADWSDVQQNDVPAGALFRAYLVSSCIVRDPRTGQFDPCALRDMLGERVGGPDAVHVERVLCDFEVVGGFNRKWRLETPQALAVKAGSIFLLKALQIVPLARLREIVDEGLGERRIEGFGRLVFLQGEGSRTVSLQNADDKSAETCDVRDRQPPKLVRFLQQRMLDAAVNRALDRKAAEIIGNRCKPPTGSLLGRLRIPLRSGNPEDGLKTLRQWLREPDAKDRAVLKEEAQKKLRECRLAHSSLHEWLRDAATADAGAKMADKVRGNHKIIGPERVKEIAKERGAYYAVRLIDAVLAALARKARKREGRQQPE